LHLEHLDDLLAALGRGEIGPRQVDQAIQEEQGSRAPEPAPTIVRPVTVIGDSVIVDIDGVGNLMVRTAKCCNPAPPAGIVGYVTRERGVTLHRRDCPVMQRLPEQRHNRLLQAKWPVVLPKPGRIN
jgi:GTP pyrophosphokinase